MGETGLGLKHAPHREVRCGAVIRLTPPAALLGTGDETFLDAARRSGDWWAALAFVEGPSEPYFNPILLGMVNATYQTDGVNDVYEGGLKRGQGGGGLVPVLTVIFPLLQDPTRRRRPKFDQ